MKKVIILQVFLLCSFFSFSQIKVVENGNVGIGVDQPLSKLSIGGNTSKDYFVNISAPKTFRGLNIERRGDPNGIFGNWQFGFVSVCEPAYGYFSLGGWGQAQAATPQNNGRSIGLYGLAGNTTSGYNSGVVGALAGNQNGAEFLGQILIKT